MFPIVVSDHATLLVHWYLLGGDVLATWAVGIGILWEADALTLNHEIARRLVLWGVIIETLFSIGLFFFDEGISRAQQSTIEAQQGRIIALEGDIKLAQTHLTDRQVDTDKIAMFGTGGLGVFRGQKLIIEVVPNDDEAARLAENLTDVMRGPLAHWDVTVQPLAEPVPNAIAIRLPIPPGIFGSYAAKQLSVGSKMWGAMSALEDLLVAQNFCTRFPIGALPPGNAWFADADPDTLTLLVSHKDRTSKDGCL